MSSIRAIAVDCGNLTVKSKSDLGELHYYNTIREERNFEQRSVFGSLKQSNQLVYDFEGERLVVGETDELSSLSLDVNTSRYSTPNFRKMFLLAVFKHVKQDGDRVRVVTGLPGKHFKHENVRNKAIKEIKKLEGIYQINGIQFEIVEIIVDLQPLATTMYLAFHDDYTHKQGAHEFIDSHILVVDLGMGSSDVTIIKKGEIDKVFELTFSMFDIYNEIGEDIQKHTAGNDMLNIFASEHISAQKIEKQVRESLISNNGKAVYKASNQDAFDITPIVFKRFEWGANLFLEELKANKINFESFANVVLTGGGTSTLLHYLKNSLTKYQDNSSVKFRMPDNVIKANARGYYVLANNPEKFLERV